MRKKNNRVYGKNISIYKVLLFLVTTIAIVYLFPKGGKFKYDYIKGKPWQYENLYAPFDFAIQKTEAEISKEKKHLKDKSKLYFLIDNKVFRRVNTRYKDKFRDLLDETDEADLKETYYTLGLSVIKTIYKFGLIDEESHQKVNDNECLISLRSGNTVRRMPFSKFSKPSDILKIADNKFKELETKPLKLKVLEILSEIIKPNVGLDKEFTDKELKKSLKEVSLIKGMISKDDLIVLNGDVVEGKVLNILKSFENASKSQIWAQSNYYWIVFGYTLLVALALTMLLLFLQKYRSDIYAVNKKVTFIFFNVLLMFFLQTFMVKYNVEYLYIVPLIILPIIIKTFFDARLALFTHVLTVLLLGYIVPNSFEFIYLHIISGIVTTLTITKMYKRASLFVSIVKITFIYMLTYFAFSIIKEGNLGGIELKYFLMFLANGLLSFLALFFVYFYEKLFGLVSDITLLELSNTNSDLLRTLNDKAPGTFQHSLQVANLAEACANEIGANSMLVRTGALYHDIGKMSNPQYFIENQTTSVNLHNELGPKDSARIILDHVLDGIEIAKKHKLPDRIIDFIRTHHGTSLVYYFYKKELDNNPEGTDLKDFKYKGPIPFSKETAILMMCDASEAASKSLKNPTAQSIDDLIDKVCNKQTSDNQFINSDLTFRELEKIKKVIKGKLLNIYHLRVEYPE